MVQSKSSGIYCRLIQLCRAAMGAMRGCCGEAPPAAPSRAPGLPFSFFSFVRLWAPVPLRAPPAGVVWAASASWASWASSWSRGARPPAGVVWGSIAPQTVAGRADGVVVFATGSLGGQACSIFQCSSVEISPTGIHSFCCVLLVGRLTSTRLDTTLPISLQSLSFDSNFHQPLQGFTFPTGVQRLCYGSLWPQQAISGDVSDQRHLQYLP